MARGGLQMTLLIVSLGAAVITALTVDWCQRYCEHWCQVRDREL
jgi:hypothetical protein